MLSRSLPIRSLSRKAAASSLSRVQPQANRTLCASASSVKTHSSSRITDTRFTPCSEQSRTNWVIARQLRSYSSTPMAAPTDTAAAEVANSTGITPETLAETLKQKLDATHVDIQDISGGCGASFTALIVSSQFQGKTALARHRLVNSALKSEIAAIHAWTPRCMTPEQWEKAQKENP